MVRGPADQSDAPLWGAGRSSHRGDRGATRHNDLWMYNGQWKQIPRPDAGPVEAESVVKGPSAVGYRVID